MNDSTVSFKPLYLQVREILLRRLIDGIWAPGELIPSETELALELGVSQGTVRKALDAMAAENLLLRRQGRGTYVAEHETGDFLFNFFRLAPDSGERVFPESRLVGTGGGPATEEEAAALRLRPAAHVWRVERVRLFGDTPILIETIVLPAERFPGFGDLDAVPNNVYRLYFRRWGVRIAAAEERLKAITASASDATHLGCDPGTPLLEIRRVATDLESNIVELRLSRCRTERIHYLSELR